MCSKYHLFFLNGFYGFRIPASTIKLASWPSRLHFNSVAMVTWQDGKWVDY